ncbi:hypothetical protein BASA62_009718 [Batrachochytrium salamandrivorans]|nr:hypothetical protein BASA62_009718 [Batrachochytrium salamandrivorans]
MLQARTVVRNRKHNVHTFNLLVAGHARSGKSSFVSTLYETLNVQKLHYPQQPHSSDSGSPSPNLPSDSDGSRMLSSSASHSLLELQLQAMSLALGDSPLPPKSPLYPMPSPAGIECDMPFGGSERLLLHLIDSPGLEVPPALFSSSSPAAAAAAEQVASKYLDSILKYIEAQFEATLIAESKVRRNPKSPDFQTHACVYMLNPDIIIASHGLSLVDRYVLSSLCNRVNVIPCLAKSDLLTVRQLRSVRSLISSDILVHNIPVYAFPDEDDEDDEPLQPEDDTSLVLRSLIPFRLVNSEVTESEGEMSFTGLVVDNKKILGREYTWGVVEVEDAEHCDFIELKNALFGSHLDDLKLSTREVLYEKWRTERLMDGSASAKGALNRISTM